MAVRLALCIICNEIKQSVLHVVKRDWAAELSAVSGIVVKERDLVCCDHFLPHSSPPGHRFGKSTFPGIRHDYAT